MNYTLILEDDRLLAVDEDGDKYALIPDIKGEEAHRIYNEILEGEEAILEINFREGKISNE